MRIFIAAWVLGTVFSASAFAKRLKVRAVNVVGRVSYKRTTQKNYKPLKNGQKLSSGSEVKASSNGRCQLVYPGSRVTVHPGTRFTVSEDHDVAKKESKPSVLVFFGKILCKTFKKKSSRLNVYTPTAVAGVRGTAFDVMVGKSGRSNILVKEGTVDAKSGKKALALNQGEQADASFLEEDFKTSPTKAGQDLKSLQNASQKELDQGSKLLLKIQAKIASIEGQIKAIELVQAKNEKERNSYKKKAIETKEKDYEKAQKLMKRYHDLNTDNVLLSKKIKHLALYAQTVYEVVKNIKQDGTLTKNDQKTIQEIKKTYQGIQNTAFPKKKGANGKKPGCCFFGG